MVGCSKILQIAACGTCSGPGTRGQGTAGAERAPVAETKIKNLAPVIARVDGLSTLDQKSISGGVPFKKRKGVPTTEHVLSFAASSV